MTEGYGDEVVNYGVSLSEVPISEMSEENYKVPSPELNTYLPMEANWPA
jgi:hypothetical protein